jgi:hypothetical protein
MIVLEEIVKLKVGSLMKKSGELIMKALIKLDIVPKLKM